MGERIMNEEHSHYVVLDDKLSSSNYTVNVNMASTDMVDSLSERTKARFKKLERVMKRNRWRKSIKKRR